MPKKWLASYRYGADVVWGTGLMSQGEVVIETFSSECHMGTELVRHFLHECRKEGVKSINLVFLSISLPFHPLDKK